jgi:hypothetical protein
MTLPTTESLKNNAKELKNMWKFPYIVGCLDGKHIRIVCPTDSGAMFFNYKEVLFCCSSRASGCKLFIAVDMGNSGNKAMDARFWSQTCFIEGKRISFPEPDSPSQQRDSSVRS